MVRRWHASRLLVIIEAFRETPAATIQRILTVVGVVVLSTLAHAQSNPIDSSRRIDWTQNDALLNPPPTGLTQCGDTISAGHTAADIQSAIQGAHTKPGCGTAGYVLLGPGTFNLTAGINWSGTNGIELRGSGPNATFLVFSLSAPLFNCVGQGGVICIDNQTWSTGSSRDNFRAWNLGLDKGTTQITVASQVQGQTDWDTTINYGAYCDQLDDTGNDTGETSGEVWNGQATNTFSQEGTSGGYPNRAQGEFHRVTAKSGNLLTISPPVHMTNWRSDRSPQCIPFPPIHDSGISNLSIDATATNSGNPDYTNYVDSAITLFNCYHCFVQKVRTINAGRNHIWLYEAEGSTLFENYHYGGQGGGSQSYGVETYQATDNAVINSACQHVTVCLMTGNGSGNVYLYDYAIDGNALPQDWQQGALYSSHDGGVALNLYEGVDLSGIENDNIHGSSFFLTVFRSVLNGREPYGGSTAGKSSQTSPVINQALSRYNNIVGNILGTSGYHTHYECAVPIGGNYDATESCSSTVDQSIFSFGFSDNQGTRCVGCAQTTNIASASVATATVITITGGHGLQCSTGGTNYPCTGDTVCVYDTNTTPNIGTAGPTCSNYTPNLLNASQFTIPVTVRGTVGTTNGGGTCSNPSTACFQGSLPNDELVSASIMLWGNCDASHGFAANQCQFNTAEVPNGLAKYANPYPSNNSLPVSMAYAAKPSWMGSTPWPPIGPDLTCSSGCVPNVGGLAYKIPARVGWEGLSDDASYSIAISNITNANPSTITFSAAIPVLWGNDPNPATAGQMVRFSNTGTNLTGKLLVLTIIDSTHATVAASPGSACSGSCGTAGTVRAFVPW